MSALGILSEELKMTWVYYLQLQDRIKEAFDMFKKVDISSAEDESMKIQYDYLSAYFDFSQGAAEGFKVARAIVEKYE